MTSQATYDIWLSDQQGNRIQLLTAWSRLEYTRILGDVGAMTLLLTEIPNINWRRDMRLGIYRDNKFDALYLLDRVRANVKLGTVELSAVCPNHLLKRRIVAYNEKTTGGKYAASALDSIMYDVVERNLGASAGAARMISNLSIIMPAGTASTTTITTAWQNVLSMLRKLFDLSVKQKAPQFFALYAQGETRLVFEIRPVLWGMDRTISKTGQVVFSPSLGTADNLAVEMDWSDEITAAYVTGQGQQNVGSIVVVNDSAVDDGPFGRIESVANASTSSDSAGQEAAGYAELAKRKRRQKQYATIIPVGPAEYKRGWDLGDKISVVNGTFRFDAVVQGVHVLADGNGESITPKLVSYDY